MNNIEEIFKASLENNEMPFDPSAWDAMSSRLDQVMPVSSTPKPSYKWAWITGAAVATVITALFIFGNEASPAPSKSPIVQSAVTEDAQKEMLVSNEQPSAKSETNETLPETVQLTSVQKSKKSGQGEGKVSYSVYAGASYEEGQGVAYNSQVKTPAPSSNDFVFIPPFLYNPKGTHFTMDLMLPLNKKYCENEKVPMKNPNGYSVSLQSESGKNYSIGAGSYLNLSLTETGTYYFTYTESGKTVKQEAFKVVPKPNADFYTNDQTLYDNGLPFNRLEANSNAESYTWTNHKGEVLSKEKECMAHLYTKGRHEITLTTENANGCKNEITKSVSCDATYNLLATTGFDPTSSIAENTTFIPYALLVRNIPFEMQIIDPKDGHIVYETKDAKQPWTGIDKKTNQMVADYSTYVWKVTIMEKAIGEPNRTYQGLITRFSNN